MTRLLIAVALAGSGARTAPALTWDDVVASYAAVRDYTCRYVKEEQAIDHGEPQTIRLSFRKPFDVRMEWLDDHGNVDQVAVYRRGMNDGKLIARRHGLLGSIVGTVRLDPRDRRALEDSRHPITEVGFGPIVDGVTRALQDRTIDIARMDDVSEGRRFELNVRPGASPLGVTGARRIVIVVGSPDRLPLSVELFDASGRRLERHRFSNVRVNVGLSDAVFTL